MLSRANRRWGVAILAALVGVMSAGATVVQADAADDDAVYSVRDLEKLERTFMRLAADVRPTVVAIQTRRNLDDSGERTIPNSQGTGFVIGSEGYVATNHHVVEGADHIDVTLWDGAQHAGKLVQFDPRSDLAVLKIDAHNLRVAALADLSEVRVGQWVFTVGSPFGLANGDGTLSVSFGGVTAIGESLTDYIEGASRDRFYGYLIQTDASINPGNSGGPLFDLNGRVVGVSTAMISRSGVDEGLGFAIPMTKRTRQVLDLLSAGEIVRYGYLGVQVTDASRGVRIGPGARAGRGALINALTGGPESSPAARAGLQPNDVITAFDGREVKNRDDLIRLVGATPVGSDVDVVYYRGERMETARVQLAERVETAAARVRSGAPEDDLRTMSWRGALLVEPSEAFLLSYGNSREKPGIYVAEVPARSALQRSGLRADCIIVRIDGKRVQTLEDFKRCEEDAKGRMRFELDDGSTVYVAK